MNVFRRVAPSGASLAAAVGLGASVASLADMGSTPAFCAASGCATVRASAWAHPLGIPLPAVGIAFFALALALTTAGPRLRTARIITAALGALGALSLIAIQRFAIGSWCQLCLIADLAALAHGALVLAAAATWPEPRARRTTAISALTAAAIALPLLVHPTPRLPPAPSSLPPVIAREQTQGVITIVDFVDFECPFCRTLHARLLDALARTHAPVRIVRKMVPLPAHRGARAAAIAWCCADAQGKGDAMADALMAAPTAALTPDGCEQIAARVGCDLARYRADAASTWVQSRLAADLADAHAADVHVLPTLYIGTTRFAGAAASADDLAAALTYRG